MPDESSHTQTRPSILESGADGNADGPPSKRRRRESEDRQRREIGLMRQNESANAPSFVGSSSGIHFVRSVYHALAKSRVRLPPATPDQNIVPGEEDQLDDAVPYSSKPIWSSDETQMIAVEPGAFDFDDLQTWSESYFENWHTAYPFVHAPTMLEYLEQHVRPDNLRRLCEQRTPQLTLLRSVMSISLADRRQSGKQSKKLIPACLVFTSFREAMESVQDMLFMPCSTEALQAVVSVQLFLVSMLRLNGASRLGGMIVRMAFQMGLHRCPTRYANFDTEQAQLRRRLFWTIYCIDRHLCQSLGLPLTIRDDDVDVCYFDQEKHATGGHHQTIMDDRLRTLNFLTKHASIKGQIVELRNKSIHLRTANRDLATLIGARIDKWANDLQYVLDAAENNEPGRFGTLHEVVLLVSQHELIISLNRPLLALEKHTPEYMAALQTCIRASNIIISSLYKYLFYRLIQRSDGPSTAPLLWPSLTWCVWMSSFIVLHAAIEGEMPKHVARNLADNSVEILRHLALRGSVWPNVCAVAINDLFLRLLLDSTVTTPQSPLMDTNHTEQQHNIDPRRNTNSNILHQDAAPRHSGNLEPLTGSSVTDNQHSLSDHAMNMLGPSLSAFEPQLSIPWLSGADAAAATSANLFEQFDIPFWMGDDQYSSLLNFDP
ncbi:unnamed protein product [Aureobasidium mustum]|uniref:Xylanolytic transcriptional activator regulatory domain-containing protein n=1 Tax=Aureobasidium mustum TaxID=2773714 RepID=A0A9N8JPV8_9PEZI|nr:unnamed protein product [Aureobasidium mustum]